jgi:hypothetical protein
MPRVGFDPTTPVFERAKTAHALDRAATVNGLKIPYIAECNCLATVTVVIFTIRHIGST